MIFVGMLFFLTAFAAANYFVGLKGWQTLKAIFPNTNSIIYWSIFIIIVVSYILSMLGRKVLPSYIEYVLNLIGSYWLGALMYLLIIIGIAEIIKLIFKLIPKGTIKLQAGNIPTIINIAIFIFTIGLLIYGTYNAQHEKVIRYDINVNKQAGNLKELNLVMVSDIHIGEIIGKSRVEGMVSKINSLNPDIVIIAGDIVDDSIEPFIKNNMGETFLKLKSKYGTFAVLGNHDYFGGNIEETSAAFKNAGINLLRDNSLVVDNSFNLYGREVTNSYK